MANAKYRDARAGFTIFFESDGTISLEELNELLQESGYGPVAQRTMTHYGKLLTAGFDRYISINRFDVARASRAYGNMSNLSRYKYRKTNRDVNVLFAKPAKLLQTRGILIESGDVGAIIELSDADRYEDLHIFRPRSGDSITISYSDREIDGTIIACDLTSRPPIVELEYQRLISLSEIDYSIKSNRRTVEFKLVSDDNESIGLDVIGRRLYYFFELLEGIRALYNEAGRHSEESNYAPPPTVTEIRVSSPATLILELAPDLIDLLTQLLLLLNTFSWREGSEERRMPREKEGRLVDTKRHTESKIESGVVELEVESTRREDTLGYEVTKKVLLRFSESYIAAEDLLRILDSDIIPPRRALAQSDIRDIEVTVDEDSDHDDKNNESDSDLNE